MKKNLNSSFNMLSCNSCLGKNDPRVSLIRTAIRDKNVKNIAVVGSYGSGKSSVISSYIKSKIFNKKTIYFSYDTLKRYEKDFLNKDKDNGIIARAIYVELLKRNTNSIVLDKYFNKLYNGFKQWALFIIFVIFALFLSAFGTYYFYQIVGWPSCLAGISFLSLLIFLYMTLSLKLLKANAKVKNGLDIVAEWETSGKINLEAIKDHPGYAENVIIKQLASQHIRYIVFEDLDRLRKEDYVEYISNIKIINNLINQSKEFGRKCKRIIFFYAIHDDQFTNSELRTKYFDLIVPVVSYATSSNASDSISLNAFIKENVDLNAVVDLSGYLLDQRQVNAVTTQFNVNRQITYSSDLYTELFALTIFNVRFPSVYSKIYSHDNFLSQLIKEYSSNPKILDSFSVKVNQANESKGLLLFRNAISQIDEFDKDNVVLFLKTCLSRKYITYNYETLLHTNVENDMSSSDNQFLKMFWAGEYDPYYQIKNPLALLNHVNSPVSLFETKKGINIYLLLYIFTTRDKPKDLQECKKTAKETLKQMADEEMELLLNDAPLTISEQLYFTLIKEAPGLTQIYYSAAEISERDLRNKICLELFNSFDSSLFEANKIIPSNYCNIVNSKLFADCVGQSIAPSQSIKMIEAKYFKPESLLNLQIDSNLVEAFAITGRYKKSFENLCIVYKDFFDKPLSIFNSNEKLYTDLQKENLLNAGLLNRCNTESTKDLVDDCLLFINKLKLESELDILNSMYFDQWKHRFVFSPNNSSKYTMLLQRGLIDFSNPLDMDIAKDIVPEHFVKAIESQQEYFSTIKFSVTLSWFLVLKLNRDKLLQYKESLCLKESINHINSVGFDRLLYLFELFDEEEKPLIIRYTMINNPVTLLDAFLNGLLPKKDLLPIKVNSTFIDLIFSKNVLSLLNICISKINAETTRQYMIDHPDLDYSNLFVGDNGEIVNCDNTDLIIGYCISKKRDFDFVRKIITTLTIEHFSNQNKWRPFLESFNLKKDNRVQKYLYYENNENNRIILEFFADNGLIKSLNYQNNNTEIRCTVSN